MRGRRADELLQQPVRLRGIRLGRIVDVIFDPDASRVLGFDVLCGDEVHRFLPFSAVGPQHAEGELEVRSALLLLDAEELAFYRRHGRSLEAGRDLRERIVTRDGAVERGSDGDDRC